MCRSKPPKSVNSCPICALPVASPHLGKNTCASSANRSRMLPPDEVTPLLSNAFRYSSATDLRCSSVIGSRLMAMLVVLLLQASTFAQVPAAWIGTWTLNVAKSTYDPGPPPYKRATYTIEPWNDGLKVTYEMVHPRGGLTHLEWVGKLDGRDYRVQGIDEVLTYAYRPSG